ncbi:MAG: hypothetical protein HCTETUND2_072 [Candidatus Hodgkinia cicadicola]|nr:MAG: hypothetical protein HCTETUND2_072 [Candidatus Hodgkinia cicadicola]
MLFRPKVIDSSCVCRAVGRLFVVMVLFFENISYLELLATLALLLSDLR